MAALQQIRNRGVVIGIIIGCALFAFIVGDALQSGGSFFTSSLNEVAEIAGESIDVQEFENRTNHNITITKIMSGQTSIPSEQTEQIREQTWQQMVQEMVMQPEYDELGIAVTSKELFDMIQGVNVDPAIKQLFQNEDGIFDRTRAIATLQQLINLPSGSEGSEQKQYWLNIEKLLTSQRNSIKYHKLIEKGLYMPDAMLQNIAKQGSKKVNLNYIVKNYNLIPDSTIAVSDSEIKAYYNEHKNLFKQAESRRIDYVPFLIEASTEDYKSTEKAITDLKPDFTEETNNQAFVEEYSDGNFNPFYLKKEEITNAELASFAFSGQEGDVSQVYLENEAYKLAKISEIKMLPDSVKARHILIAAPNGDYETAQAKADSLKTLIEKGARFDKLARTNSADQNSAVNGGDLGWFTQERMVLPFSQAAFSAKKNEVKVVLTQFGAHVLQVTNRGQLVKKVQLAIVKLDVEPSNKTIQEAYAKARSFANNNVKREAFLKAISEENLHRRSANLKRDIRNIPGLENSKSLIRAAYSTDNRSEILMNDNKSPVFELGNQFVVAILSSVKEKGYSPIEEVASSIKREVRKKKKAEQIVAELNKNSKGAESLLSIAQKENLEMKTATDIGFESFQIPGAGIEPKVIATAVLSEKATISAPVIGNQGVYMLTVTNETMDEVNDETLKAVKTKFEQDYQYRTNIQTFQALKENANVIDKRYKFY